MAVRKKKLPPLPPRAPGVWRDATSYGRDERGKADARVWALEGAKVFVHRRHGLGALWFVSAHDLKVDNWELVAKDIEAALAEGIEVVREYLKERLAELPSDSREGSG